MEVSNRTKVVQQHNNLVVYSTSIEKKRVFVILNKIIIKSFRSTDRTQFVITGSPPPFSFIILIRVVSVVINNITTLLVGCKLLTALPTYKGIN